MSVSHLLIIAALLIVMAYGHMNLETSRRIARHAGMSESELSCPSLWGWSRHSQPFTTGPQWNPKYTLADTLTHAQKWEQARSGEAAAQRKRAVEAVKGG